MKTNLSGSSKEEVLSNFRNLLATTDLGRTSKGGGGEQVKYKLCDTVDGNPYAATKLCFPYGSVGGLTMGINGPRGGKSGHGTFGD